MRHSCSGTLIGTCTCKLHAHAYTYVCVQAHIFMHDRLVAYGVLTHTDFCKHIAETRITLVYTHIHIQNCVFTQNIGGR